MKYAITINGQFRALVDVQLDPKQWDGSQAFGGKIDAGQQWGVSAIEDGQVQLGSGLLVGHVNLHGHDGEFSAKIEGETISGHIKYGPFHMLAASFAGVATT